MLVFHEREEFENLIFDFETEHKETIIEWYNIITLNTASIIKKTSQQKINC